MIFWVVLAFTLLLLVGAVGILVLLGGLYLWEEQMRAASVGSMVVGVLLLTGVVLAWIALVAS